MTGSTIQASKRFFATHLSEPQPDSPIRPKESTALKKSGKGRKRRMSQSVEDGNQDSSCDIPKSLQIRSTRTTVPTSSPPLPRGFTSTITKAPPPDDESEKPEEEVNNDNSVMVLEDNKPGPSHSSYTSESECGIFDIFHHLSIVALDDLKTVEN